MPTSPGEITLNTRELAKEFSLVVHLRHLKRWRWRLRVAENLVYFASWLCWFDVPEIHVDLDRDDEAEKCQP